MIRKTGPKARLNYYAIRFAAFILQMFPIDLNLRTARWAGRLLGIVVDPTKTCRGDESSKADGLKIHGCLLSLHCIDP